MRTVIAKWQSRNGAYTVELYKDEFGWGYSATNAAGYMGNNFASDEEAIAELELRINDFQPDRNVTPMRRVK